MSAPQMSRSNRSRRICAALIGVVFALGLAACGVHFEIAPEAFPTPTATPQPAANWYDDSGVSRLVGTPQIVFGEGGARAALFMQPSLLDVFALQGHGLWLYIHYNATWFDNPVGDARVRLTVYTRTGDDQPWTVYGSAEADLTAQRAPFNRRDEIGVYAAADTVGRFRLRAELSIVAFPQNSSALSPVNTVELNVIVFSQPEGLAFPPEALRPPRDLDMARPLLDWRSWEDGACRMNEQWGTEFPALGEACAAQERGDIEALTHHMAEALAALRPEENLALAAHLHTASGLIRFEAGDAAGAVNSFESAVGYYALLDQAALFTQALHNLGAAHTLAGQVDVASVVYQMVREMRAQLGDEPGRMLTQANQAHQTKVDWQIEETLNYFEQEGLPQAAVARRWLEELHGGE